MARTVADDPGLALWLACRFPADRIPTGCDDLAAWFTGAWHTAASPGLLDWTPADGEDEAEALPPAAAASSDWLQLTTSSLAVSRYVAATMAGHPRVTAATLIGLLHASLEMLAACGPRIRLEEIDQADHCLPAWLVAALVELDRDDASDAVYGSIQNAIRQSDGPSPAPPAASPATEPAGYAALLPELVRAAARLRMLEEEFSSAVEAAKMNAMRELAYGASHEINNPLANISTRAQTLLIDETDPERRRKLATINSQAFRAHEMISDIMLFAKPPRIEVAEFELRELVAEVLAELADDAAEQGTELQLDLPDPDMTIVADRGHLTVAVKSLVRNALEALGLGGRVELLGRRVAATAADQGAIEIVVRDTGPGVPAEARRSMFNPFYSGREAGRGLGLGLSKCWRIVTLHGGTISLDDSYPDGACFVIRLPAPASVVLDSPIAAHG